MAPPRAPAKRGGFLCHNGGGPALHNKGGPVHNNDRLPKRSYEGITLCTYCPSCPCPSNPASVKRWILTPSTP